MKLVPLVQIILIVLLLEGCHCSSSSSGSNVARQSCGTNNAEYCCPSGGQSCLCTQRSKRCTSSEQCDYQDMGGVGGDKCFATSGGLYEVKLGRSPLLGSSSKRKRLAFEHQFIQYRGFTYEFGKGYGVQILDVNDPIYKYKSNRDVTSIKFVGTSQCSWEEATLFTTMWKKSDYRLFSNNCQHFADALKVFLTGSSCSDGSSRNKRQTQGVLEAEIDQILTDCNITCCYDNNDSGSSSVTISISAFSVLLGFLITGVVY